MTVQSTTSRISYAGNGVTLGFAVPFRFLANTHLLVVLRAADGTETTQVLTTNYTVTGARSQSGGAVGMLVAPPAGTTLVITRNVPLTQLIDYKANDPFPEESAEDGLDQLTMALQQQTDTLGRALVLFDTDTDGSGRYNANGNRVVSAGNAVDAQDLVPLVQVQSITAGAAGGIVPSLIVTYPEIGSTVAGKGAAYVGWPAGHGINQAGTNQHFAQNGAGIHRMNDRIFVGDATVNDGAFPNVVLDWFSTFQVGLGIGAGSLVSSVAAVLSGANANSAIPILGAARTLNFTAAGTTALGVMGVAVNNNTTLANQAYGGYFEGHTENATVGPTYGVEIDIRAMVSQQAAHPFQQGSTHTLQLASGCGVGGGSFTASIAGTVMTVTAVSLLAGYTLGVGTRIYGAGAAAGQTIVSLGTGTGGTGTYNLGISNTLTSRDFMASNQFRPSAHIYISENPVPTQAGIVFGARSIDGCDGVNGVAEAISLAKGQYLRWYSAGGVANSLMYSTATTLAGAVILELAEGFFSVSNASTGGRMFECVNSSTYVNYLRIQPAATGGAVVLQALGTDANIDLQLTPKGTGTARFGTFTGSADVPVNGYITIKDAGGTVRKLATVA